MELVPHQHMGKGTWEKSIQVEHMASSFIHYPSMVIPDEDSCVPTKGGCNSSPSFMPSNEGFEPAQCEYGDTENLTKKRELNGDHKHISELH